jgi:hypothetical protein
MWKGALCPLQNIVDLELPHNLEPVFCPRRGTRQPFMYLVVEGLACQEASTLDPGPALDHWLLLIHLCLELWPCPSKLHPMSTLSFSCNWGDRLIAKAPSSCWWTKHQVLNLALLSSRLDGAPSVRPVSGVFFGETPWFASTRLHLLFWGSFSSLNFYPFQRWLKSSLQSLRTSNISLLEKQNPGSYLRLA